MSGIGRRGNRTVVCYVCHKPVETYETELEYHKGLQRYGFKTIYPHEEKRIEFPEGRQSGIHVCQDCLDRPGAMKKLIKLARMNAVKSRIERAKKRETQDKNRIKFIRKRRKENVVRHGKLKEYLKSIENDEDPVYEWDVLKIDDPM